MDDTPPELDRFKYLYDILWHKNDTLRDAVFLNFDVEVPTFDDELNTKEITKVKFRQLSLERVIAHYEHEHPMQLELQFLLPCDSDYLLVRPAYEEAFEILNDFEDKRPGRTKRLINEDGSFRHTTFKSIRQRIEKAVIFSGHPGIGKSWFLSYLLVERLLRGEATIFQVARQNDLTQRVIHFLFDNCGVRIMDKALEKMVSMDSTIWALADQKPAGMLWEVDNHQWLVVVASSPKVDNFKTLRKEYSARQYYMPSWDWGEIVATSTTLNNMSSRKLGKLFSLFQKYGPLARTLFQELYPVNPPSDEFITNAINQYEKRLDTKIKEMLQYNPIAYSTTQFEADDSHTIILLEPEPEPDDTFGYKYISAGSTLSIVTPYVGWKIGLVNSEHTRKGAKALYDWLLGQAQTRPAAGWVFEARVHATLQNGGCYDLELMCGTSRAPVSMNIKYKGQTFSTLGQLGTLLRKTKGSFLFKEDLLDHYIQLERCNLASIDALVITTDPTTHKPRAILLQITVGKSHPIKASGLASVLKELPAEVKEIDPIIVFVVPAYMKQAYKPQQIEPVGTNHPSKDWSQYVMSIDDLTLWGRNNNVGGRRGSSLPTPSLNNWRTRA